MVKISKVSVVEIGQLEEEEAKAETMVVAVIILIEVVDKVRIRD